MKIKATLLCAVFALSACAQDAPEDAAKDTAPAETQAAAVDYAAIVATDSRSGADRERDAARKPAETLAFMQIKPGDKVFEVEAGGGYFTELYSLLVGPDGEVVMQNFQGFVDYAKEEIETRFADNRLPNVRMSVSLHDDLDAADASMDAATWVQGPHELYYKETPDMNLGDPAGSFAEIYRVLKPGGAFTVIDHAAVEGAPVTVGNDLHRIAKQHVIDLATGAGFVLEEEADFLANPEDDRTMLAFAPDVRGKTDQFVLRFRKPE